MIPEIQHAVIITAAGGPEVLFERFDWPVPAQLGPDDVLIEIAAAGINRHDCNQRAAGPSREPNPVPGLEASGRIVACGSNVAKERLGEAVIALTDGGAYAQYVATDQHLALPMPDGFDWVRGVALPEALFTTWFNFFDLMRMAPGETALIHGGSSGVGTIAIQLLHALGHDVFATAGTEEKRAVARGLGARAVFDYADPDLAEQVRAATNGRGVDCILDTSAGAHIMQDLAALAAGGRIAFLSAGGGKELSVPLRSLMARRASVTGAFLRSTPLELKRRIAGCLQQQVWPLLASAVRPYIDRVYPLSEAARAHAHMESNGHIGKIVLSVRE
ncbi:MULTISPECIES: NAD(P)H-quinone oxidoreductase [unclassified Bradyrhizobium]|uniref:NAD(P)H-quinone oxidoreductase n=1 Tax=unclassified Bradyrhizobium TaxID=2631580 RepID=UPI002916F698|nr:MULTISPECIES: NAD(P)H-quinone oxidoreductase [unclassified Bradyrhizobium]